MAAPHITTAEDATLEATDKVFSAALAHLRKLLRIKNSTSSSFLRLPTEIIIRILSFVNEGCYHDWRSIFSTCHRIFRIMLESTEPWWKVNFNHTTSSLKAAQLALLRSKGNPRKLIAGFGGRVSSICQDAVSFLSDWENGQVFQNTRLHTLEFSGTPAVFSSLSWVLEGSLPHLEHLTIQILPPFNNYLHLDGPLSLYLPTNIPLRTLDLFNIFPFWSPGRLTGLRELHLRFGFYFARLSMLEDELLGILNASPQLERLSLQRIRVGDNPQLHPKHVVQLPSLTSLSLENSPEVVGHILAHMDIPVISSLTIVTYIPFDKEKQAFGYIFPDDHVSTKLFSDPPVFKIEELDCEFIHHTPWNTLTFHIGNFKMKLMSAHSLDAGITTWFPLVPSSLTTLQTNFSMLDQQEWREFFLTHREVRSVECGWYAFESLWDALSPVQEGDHQVVLCPSLGSICFQVNSEGAGLTSLLSCLRDRKATGFGLKHLNINGVDRQEAWKMAEDFRPLVEVLEVKLSPIVSPTLTH
jgi:hypothetical protein